MEFKIYLAWPEDWFVKSLGRKIGANPRSSTLRRIVHNLSDGEAFTVQDWIEVHFNTDSISAYRMEASFHRYFDKWRNRHSKSKKGKEWFFITIGAFVQFAKKQRQMFGDKVVTAIERHRLSETGKRDIFVRAY